MRARCSSSMPVVTKRSSALPDSSITPSAAYWAPVSAAAVSTSLLEQRVERQLRVESEAGLEELAQAALAAAEWTRGKPTRRIARASIA